MIIKTLFFRAKRAKSSKNVINSAFFLKFAAFFRKMPDFFIIHSGMQHVSGETYHAVRAQNITSNCNIATWQPNTCRFSYARSGSGRAADIINLERCCSYRTANARTQTCCRKQNLTSKEKTAVFPTFRFCLSVSIGDVEAVVSGAAASWVQRLSEGILSELATAAALTSKSVVCQIAKQAFGEENTQSVETWVNTTETSLYNGDTSKVIAGIRTLSQENPAIRDIVEKETRYFQKHAHRMQYRTLNEKGYHIGSGVKEGILCKS